MTHQQNIISALVSQTSDGVSKCPLFSQAKRVTVKLTVLSWYCQKLELPSHTHLFINLLRPSLCHFHIQEWDVISLEAKNLISHLLVRDATKRYTTEMILQHPWIQEVTFRSLLPSFLFALHRIFANLFFTSSSSPFPGVLRTNLINDQGSI